MLKIRKTRNDFFVQVRNLLLPLGLKVLRHKEREAQSFYSGFFICPPKTCGTRHKGLCEQAKTSRLPPRQVSSQLTDFKFPKSSVRFRCVTSFAFSSPRFPSQAIVTSLSDTSAPSARAWTPVLMLHLSNRKVLSLTKLKGMKRNRSAIILHKNISPKKRAAVPVCVFSDCLWF